MSLKIDEIYCDICKSKRVTRESDARLRQCSMTKYSKIDNGQPKMMKPVLRFINITLRCEDCGYTVGYKKQVTDYVE